MTTTLTWIIAAIGWAGAACVLLAYLLLLRRSVSAYGLRYLSLNLLGSACLAVSTSAAHAWPSAAVNLIWLALGMAPLMRAWGTRHSRRPRLDAATDPDAG